MRKWWKKVVKTLRSFFGAKDAELPLASVSVKTKWTGHEVEKIPVDDWKLKKKAEIFKLSLSDNPSIISHIVIHHSLSEDGITRNWDAIRSYHIFKGWSDIGYHFGVERIGNDYEVVLGRKLDKRGAHAKDGGFNRKSIGICVVGNFDNAPPPENQRILTEMLTTYLIDYYREHGSYIPVKNVIGHREAQEIAGVSSFHIKTCPGLKFDMDYFRFNVNKGYRIP